MANRFSYDRMNAREFRESLDHLGLAVPSFSRITGAGLRTVQRWATGENEIPVWVGLLLYTWEEDTRNIAVARTYAAWAINADALRQGVPYPYRQARRLPLDGPEEV